MQRRVIKLTGLVSVLALLGSASTFATTLQKMSMEEMAQSADIVVVGLPVDAVVVREQGRIVTQTTFTVSADAFGGAPTTVTVSAPGGMMKIGKVQGAEVVAGAPAFAGGNESMLFLNESSDGVYEVTGFNQGAFGVADGEVMFAPSDGGATEVSMALEKVRKARNANAKRKLDD